MRRARTGSALIIMLGMLSFLTISAIAFSAYMRYSRAPSSYMLRSSSARWLVKAALAEAMNDIENSIGNGPHPGVPGGSNSPWRNRILYRIYTAEGDNGETLVDNGESEWGETVPTLTFEGLAYVPAPLINLVRYYSRHTSTATWKGFDFDAGRFAYTAVDVSDYYDINRTPIAAQTTAGGKSKLGGRTSADNSRVTLAYLLEDDDHASAGDVAERADAWADFMDNYVSFDEEESDGSTLPLVSWADLNLAIDRDKPEGFRSPWCDFVRNRTEFDDEGQAGEMIPSNMVFVTDSLYPQETATEKAATLDLSDSANQPFSGLRYKITDKTAYVRRGVDELAQNNNAFLKKFDDNILLPELVQLCDYLDVDSVPTSLAMPTTERVPMLIGVSLNAGSELRYEIVPTTREIKLSGQSNGGSAGTVRVTRYTLRLSGELHPMIAAVYPFKHGRGADDQLSFSSFDAQIAATVTLVPKGAEKKLRSRTAVEPAVCTWGTAEKGPMALAYPNTTCKSVMFVRSKRVGLKVNRDPETIDDCLILPSDDPVLRVSFDMTAQMEKTQFDTTDEKDVCTFRVAQKYVKDQNGNEVASGDPEITKGFLPSNADLSGAFKPNANDIGAEDEFVPVIQVWVRIVGAAKENSDEKGETVDLMPACVNDDRQPSELLLGDNVKSAFMRPFLRFYDQNGAMTVKFSQQWFADANKPEMTIAPHAYVADDPRFNHAPEDLVAVSELTEEIQTYWKANNTAPGTGDDKDIFMATSDAGYLQSKYEIAHLLRLTGLNAGANEMWGVLDNGGYDGEMHTAFGGAPSKAAQWRTYTPYPVGGQKDDFDVLKMTGGSRGTRVCPYTPDLKVMMGALANTPYDWWAASTNCAEGATVKSKMLTDFETALKYTFSEHGERKECRVAWEALEDLAWDFIGGFRKSATAEGWQTVYDAFDWNGSFLDALEEDSGENGSGITLDSVDRKFLYGYWRECFAVRQQLFLVFIRAEPMMMGGGGHIPATLGGRAVALVWRDPTTTASQSGSGTSQTVPHNMRVLFYKPLD